MLAHLLFEQQDCKYSSDIIASWEANHKSLVSDRHHKRPALESAVKMCGLSTTGLNIPKMRALLVSLKTNKLPVSAGEVGHLLTNKHGQAIGGEHYMISACYAHKNKSFTSKLDFICRSWIKI